MRTSKKIRQNGSADANALPSDFFLKAHHHQNPLDSSNEGLLK